MGIQINGQTDTITAVDGALTVSGADLPTVTNLNATGISTFSNGIVIGTGTSISSPATNTLTLGTNNAERLRVSAGGVSIGSIATYGDSNASFTSLSLGGNGTRYGLLEIKQSNGVAGAWIDSYGTGGNGDLRITTAGTSGAITFWTGGAFTEKVRIDSSGNLGIGTANPSQKLEVVGGEIKAGRVDSTNEGGQVSFGRATDNATAWYLDVYGNTSTPSLRFVDVTNSAVRATIDSSGRVLKPYQPHIFGSVTSSTQINSFANSMNVVTSTELTFSNSRITVPVAGVYMITFTTLSENVSGRRDANIYINGVSRLAMLTEDNSSGYKYRSGSMSIKLAASDYIQFYNTLWYDYTSTSFIDWRTASVTFLG